MVENLRWGDVWPSAQEFERLAADRRVVPVVTKVLVDDAAPMGIYRRLAQGKGTFILESAEHDGRWDRWSFVGVRSSAHIVTRHGYATWHGDVPEGLLRQGSTVEVLDSALRELEVEAIPGMPPLTGGLVGALGWDTLYDWEPMLAREAESELTTPDAALCLAVDMAAVDHQKGEVWLISNAINGNNLPSGARAAYSRARERLSQMVEALNTPITAHPATCASTGSHTPRLRTTREHFEEAVRAGKEAIREGEVFQVVLSQRADVECCADPLDVYRVLRTINPSPYMYFLHLENGQGRGFSVVGSSPETLMRLHNGKITTFPIAGSRPRGATKAEDEGLEQELLSDPKEKSEHAMLVDLSRNDLAKVCVPGTVEVSDLMHIKRYSHIMHITSTVSGILDAGKSPVDCFAATFPAGTLSGAPKPRAIELIDELEPVRRGLYGGVVGYFDFSCNADLAIAIRTAVIDRGHASVQAGAGIVADSVPASEFMEVSNKAAAALRAIHIANELTTTR